MNRKIIAPFHQFLKFSSAPNRSYSTANNNYPNSESIIVNRVPDSYIKQANEEIASFFGEPTPHNSIHSNKKIDLNSTSKTFNTAFQTSTLKDNTEINSEKEREKQSETLVNEQPNPNSRVQHIHYHHYYTSGNANIDEGTNNIRNGIQIIHHHHHYYYGQNAKNNG